MRPELILTMRYIDWLKYACVRQPSKTSSTAVTLRNSWPRCIKARLHQKLFRILHVTIFGYTVIFICGGGGVEQLGPTLSPNNICSTPIWTPIPPPPPPPKINNRFTSVGLRCPDRSRFQIHPSSDFSNRSDSNHCDFSCDFYPLLHRFRCDFGCIFAGALRFEMAAIPICDLGI